MGNDRRQSRERASDEPDLGEVNFSFKGVNEGIGYGVLEHLFASARLLKRAIVHPPESHVSPREFA
jgi:hypothetical protein